MKPFSKTLFILPCFATSLFGEVTESEVTKLSPEEAESQIIESSEALAEVQDELSADVMELVESQTVPDVIKMLEEVEQIMAEVTDDLIEGETGGPTMAAQTEIIEKILDAAKKKQQSSGEQSEESKESMGAMLDMMERMMGKEPGEQKGPPKRRWKGSQRRGRWRRRHRRLRHCQRNGVSGNALAKSLTERVIPKGKRPFRPQSSQRISKAVRRLQHRTNQTTNEDRSSCCLSFSSPSPSAMGQSLPRREANPISPQVESMYTKGLRFLAKEQHGERRLERPLQQRTRSGRSLPVLAFLAHGEDPNHGPYSQDIFPRPSGYLSRANKIHPMATSATVCITTALRPSPWLNPTAWWTTLAWQVRFPRRWN